ncbi:MAG: DUF4147 domain-containing protein [Gemmatimonadetes bacterium]|nr:DUF4147 domain-containing protein [Gemmatimonadota bacterium]
MNGAVGPPSAAGGAPEALEIRLRGDARRCLDVALRAVDPERLVAEWLGREPARAHGNVIVLAVGKAAVPMARGAHAVLADAVSRGVVLGPGGAKKGGVADAAGAAGSGIPPGLRLFRGGHPIPDEAGVEGARAVLGEAARAGASDLILLLLSGGGSALLTLPPDDVPLADLAVVTERLLKAGAPIHDLNCVRKHLDRLKGGFLARAASPARVLALVLSDVVGDRLDVIASGPVSSDPTTYGDAIATLERYGLWGEAPGSVPAHLEAGARGEIPETPKPGDPVFDRVATVIVGNGRRAAEAALAEARRLGYGSALLTDSLTGEARDVGRYLAGIGRGGRDAGAPIQAPGCVVAAGETVVTVRGPGRGGRNQEVALGAALELDGVYGILVAALGTDGIDGPTDAAGAIATWTTMARARAAGLDGGQALARNDAYPFFRALGDLIVTGPTGTNVMDLYLTLVAAAE